MSKVNIYESFSKTILLLGFRVLVILEYVQSIMLSTVRLEWCWFSESWKFIKCKIFRSNKLSISFLINILRFLFRKISSRDSACIELLGKPSTNICSSPRLSAFSFNTEITIVSSQSTNVSCLLQWGAIQSFELNTTTSCILKQNLITCQV